MFIFSFLEAQRIQLKWVIVSVTQTPYFNSWYPIRRKSNLKMRKCHLSLFLFHFENFCWNLKKAQKKTFASHKTINFLCYDKKKMCSRFFFHISCTIWISLRIFGVCQVLFNILPLKNERVHTTGLYSLLY